VTAATVPGSGSREVEPAARAIAKAAPRVVIMGLAHAAPVFVRALRAAGGRCAVFGLSAGLTPANLQALDDVSRGLTFSIVVPSPFVTRHEIVRRYRTHMREFGSGDYSLAGLEGYVNALVLTEGLRRAGRAPSRAAVLAALESIESLDLGGMRVGFGKGQREGSSFVDVAVIGEGGAILS
jgi:branched-chain amino acid transport system substrate-binding protein